MTPVLWSGCRWRLIRQSALLLVVAFAPIPAGARSAATDPALEVDHYLGMQMKRLHIPGMAVAVVKEGHIVLARDYGIGSVEFGLPVGPDTVFAINSVTKAFTGVAAMQLVAQGRLDLSAPVGHYLSDLPETWRGVTIRQLLSHMSGLPDVMRAPTVETDAATAWSWVQQQPIRFPPGERFSYCQTNYTLIQRVLNTIEGRASDAPLAEEQLRRVGMAHTFYGDAYDVIPNKVLTYRWALPGPFVNGYSGAAPDAPRTLKETSERFLPFRRASSGLNSTAADMANWLIALAGDGLMPRAARDTMWSSVAFSNGASGQWGLGWEIFARGSHRAVGMTGGGRAAIFYYPDDGIGVVILTNLTGAFPEDMVDKIASLYAPDLPLSGIPALRIALEERGYDHIAQAAGEIEARDAGLVWSEMELNDWGYRLLSTGRAREAVYVFTLIAQKYPDSVNAHDSLAQSYHVIGNIAASRQEYQHVLELDPGNESARRHRQELESKL